MFQRGLEIGIVWMPFIIWVFTKQKDQICNVYQCIITVSISKYKKKTLYTSESSIFSIISQYDTE